MVLTPTLVDGQVTGYAIAPASDAAVLARAKLRPGDLLMELDGRPLDSARIKTLGDELSVADRVEIAFERDGQLRKRVIDLTENQDAP